MEGRPESGQRAVEGKAGVAAGKAEKEGAMRFRPCIDIHNGKVKQIVGGSLSDAKESATENFVAGEEQDAAFYARLYREAGLCGGHVILLNAADSDYYEATRREAVRALKEYPGGLQLGGGVTAENAASFLEAGASHVIVTSYVFRNGRIHYENLCRISEEVGKERLVLDLSCRKRDGFYYIVTDRWQKFTGERITPVLLDELKEYCVEFHVHAVDVEGKANGIERELAAILGGWAGLPVIYAGGIGNFCDLAALNELGRGRLDVTIGSALDLFGGPMCFDDVIRFMETAGESRKEG